MSFESKHIILKTVFLFYLAELDGHQSDETGSGEGENSNGGATNFAVAPGTSRIGIQNFNSSAFKMCAPERLFFVFANC